MTQLQIFSHEFQQDIVPQKNFSMNDLHYTVYVCMHVFADNQLKLFSMCIV